MAKYNKICENTLCRKAFETNRANKKFCSKECSKPEPAPLVTKVCENVLCKKEFQCKSSAKKFCSPECQKSAAVSRLYVDEDGGLPMILVDTRENKPYRFAAGNKCAGCELHALPYGDYAVKGRLGLISIERKQNISELAGNLSHERERFERELERMQKSKFRFVIVEDYYSSIWKNHSKMNPLALFETIMSMELKYDVRFIFAGNRDTARAITKSLLLNACKYNNEGVI